MHTIFVCYDETAVVVKDQEVTEVYGWDGSVGIELKKDNW
jgi:hypothetical protein